jgi:hypothetical protein
VNVALTDRTLRAFVLGDAITIAELQLLPDVLSIRP